VNFRGATRLGRETPQGTLLSLEGNIGAGKTTFLSLLKERCGVRALFEPMFDTPKNADASENLLKLFYDNPSRWGLTFQSYAFLKRTSSYLEAIKQGVLESGITMMDRSVYSDCHCFARNIYDQEKMTPFEWEIYRRLFDWVTGYFLPYPDGIVYLKVSPSTCQRRIKVRGRDEEKSIPISYLDAIGTRHDEWLMVGGGLGDQVCDVPVLVLNGELDFEHDPKVFQQFSENIMAFVERIRRQRDAVPECEKSLSI
jgi:deoxyadenosine/deoxycytidine kinase